MINETLKVNNHMYAQKVLSKSMIMPSNYELAYKDYYEDIALYESKRQKEK